MSRIFGPEWNYFTSNRDVNFHGAVKMFFEQVLYQHHLSHGQTGHCVD